MCAAGWSLTLVLIHLVGSGELKEHGMSKVRRRRTFCPRDRPGDESPSRLLRVRSSDRRTVSGFAGTMADPKRGVGSFDLGRVSFLPQRNTLGGLGQRRNNGSQQISRMAASSPITPPASHLPSQISPHSPSPTGSPPSSLDLLPLTFTSSAMEQTTMASCSLRISPSILVVRFGDPATANCSKAINSMMGWVDLSGEIHGTESFLVWSVDNLTEWSLSPVCYAMSDEGGQCSSSLSVIVYQPPKTVSIRFLNHSGPMYESRQYILQCTVEDVAPVEKLVVTFYKGRTALAELRSNRTAEKTPVKESFSLLVAPCRGDNGNQYWCEAKLELGPSGPQQPPAERSQNITATVLWDPEHIHPSKLHMEEKPLDCEVQNQTLGGNGLEDCRRQVVPGETEGLLTSQCLAPNAVLQFWGKSLRQRGTLRQNHRTGFSLELKVL
ncbi:hypothetical protein CCH79_00015053, partial [Gambusia affinis]